MPPSYWHTWPRGGGDPRLPFHNPFTLRGGLRINKKNSKEGGEISPKKKHSRIPTIPHGNSFSKTTKKITRAGGG